MSDPLKFPSNYEPDPNDPNNKHLNDALNARPTEVSIMHPLELWMDREFLIAETQLALDTLQRNHDWSRCDETQRNYVQAMVQQRVEFLEWLREQREDRVYVALYPVNNDSNLALGEDDEDIGDQDFNEYDDLPL